MRACEVEILDTRGCEVARVVTPVAPCREVDPCDLQDANVALLCAAPDLLAACEYAYKAAAAEWVRCGRAHPLTPMSALMEALAGPIARARADRLNALASSVESAREPDPDAHAAQAEPPLVVTGPGGDFRVEHRSCACCKCLFARGGDARRR